MKIAVIMLHYGSLAKTAQTLKSLVPRTPPGTTLYLVNNSSDSPASLLRIFPQTVLIDNRVNLGFAKGVNQGIQQALRAGADYLTLMNNDLHITTGTLKQLTTELVRQPQVGIVAPILRHAGGRQGEWVYDWGGSYSPFLARVKHNNFPTPPKTALTVTHTAAAMIMFRPALVKQIGLLDERFFLYYEDLDFCLRTLAAGHRIVLTPQVMVEHATSSGSTPVRRTLYQLRSHAQFVTKYLFKRAYPTAYFYTFVMYPLFILKSLVSQGGK